MLFVNKYKPESLQDIVGNKEKIERLIEITNNKNIPNIILSGPPGCGKTSSAVCLSKIILKDKFDKAYLELNSSDSRGIDVIRERIKIFSQLKLDSELKIIFLDEADNMTSSAQQALRRIMELYSHSTRFILSCNISSNIIEPIQSRCTILRYTKILNDDIKKRLKYICKLEKIEYTKKGLDAIILTSNGDMRTALNNLSSTYYGFNLINEEFVFKICDIPNPNIIEKIINSCLNSDIYTAVDNINILYNNGYNAEDVINIFKLMIKKNNEIDDRLKLEYLYIISNIHLRIADGCNTLLQLNGLCAKLCQLNKLDFKKKNGK